MDIPTTLKHKPVIVAQNYDKVDGRIVHSDAKGLSLGLAQWNDRGKVDISAKIWRYTGEKWSRQSEEMPLHRVIDLAILICRSKKYFNEAYRYSNSYDENQTKIDRIPLQGDALDISVCVNNAMIDEDIRLFRDALTADDEMMSERLRRLSAILKEMGY
jgi:hypothetical protein